MGTAGDGILKTHAMAEADIEWLREDLKRSEKLALIFTHYAFLDVCGKPLKKRMYYVKMIR